MNINSSLSFFIFLCNCINLFSGVEVSSYIMAGLHSKKNGGLYRSFDLGKTWQQIDKKAQVNYALTISNDNRVYYRNQNDNINSCPIDPTDKSNCDGRFNGFKARTIAADADGIFYLSNKDNDVIHVSANPDWTPTYGLKNWWTGGQGCHYNIKNIAKGLAPINNFRTFYVDRNAPGVWLFHAKDCLKIAKVYDGTDIQAIAAAPNGELYIIDNTNPDGRWRLYHRWWSDGHIEEIGIDFTDVAVAPDGSIFGLRGDRELWKSKDYGKSWFLVANNLPIDHIAIRPIFYGTTIQDCNAWCGENIVEPNDFNITKGVCKKICDSYGQLSEVVNNDSNRLIENLKICATTNDNIRKAIIDAIYEIGLAKTYEEKTNTAIKKAQIVIDKLKTSIANCGGASTCDGSSRNSKGYTQSPKKPVVDPITACTRCVIDSSSSKAAAMVAYAACIDQLPGLEWLFDYLNSELDRCIGAATAKSGDLIRLNNQMQCLKSDLDACINS